jgi:hypothetical protein
MSDDKLSFLDETPEDAPKAVEPEASPPRDDAGRFAPKETGDSEVPPAEPVVPAGVSPAPEVPREQHSVPLSVLLEERKTLREQQDRERNEFQRQLQEMRQSLAQVTQPKPQPVQIPDPNEDLEGFLRFQQQAWSVQMDDREASISEYMARDKYGDDACSEALRAAQQAGVVQHFTSGPDRWGRLVKWHKQQSAVAEIGDDPNAYRERVRAEARAEFEAEMASRQQHMPPGAQRPATPPPSLAASPSTGPARAPGGKGSAFDRAFPG